MKKKTNAPGVVAARITFYGADWCPDCRRAKDFLLRHGIDYTMVDVDQDRDAAALVRRINNGKAIIPTIIIDGRTLTNPDNAALAEVLGLDLSGPARTFDVLIAGGGAAGLTASIYLQRDRFETAVLERRTIGGNAALTERIENYPGFRNISGPELMEMMAAQAGGYGAVIETGAEVREILPGANGFTVRTGMGTFRAPAVVLAVGSEYRTLGVPGETELVGAGVHFCATCDGPFYRGRDVIVIGGGNSALEEGLYLARFCRKVTIVTRGPSFTASRFYRDKLGAAANVETLFNRSVVAFEKKPGADVFRSLVIKENETGEQSRLTADGVFVFIGQRPNTGFLEGSVDLDADGYVLTDGLNETSRRGVFAAGDCRKGALAQVATATGEGVVAAYGARDFLSGARR